MGPYLRIGLASDWHIGASSDKQIRRCLSQMKEENPDIIAHLGDFNGGYHGAKATRTIMKLTREEFPDIPVVAVLGNHDFWVRGRKFPVGSQDDLVMHFTGVRTVNPTTNAWNRNYAEILETFKEFKIHFLDEDGLWRDSRWPGVVILGNTLWYENDRPPTNDEKFLPKVHGGDIHADMCKRYHGQLEKALDGIQDTDTLRIFCSHMPVMYPRGRSQGDQWFGGPERVGNMLWENFKFRYFLNGHSHQFWNAFPRFEAGSDYGNPKYLIVPVYPNPSEDK